MKKIFAANWKLFKTPSQTREFFKNFRTEIKNIKDQIIFFPPATSWEATSQSLSGSPIQWGAQNTYCEGQGAFTGENSAVTLKELGGQVVLVGHSERRKVFGESEDLLAKKVSYSLSLGITPMLCVGETLQERDAGLTHQVTAQQLTKGLSLCAKGAQIIVAYEPVWAIGTGRVATPEQAQDAHEQVKIKLKELGFEGTAVLYGGSVKPDNAKELLAKPAIDGFLVGGASLELKSFLAICQSHL